MHNKRSDCICSCLVFSYFDAGFQSFHLLTALLTATILIIRFCFSQIWTFYCLFLSTIGTCTFMYAGVTPEVIIFSLPLRDMCLSPIHYPYDTTPSVCPG